MAVLTLDDEIMRRLEERAEKDGISLEAELDKLLGAGQKVEATQEEAAKPSFMEFLINYPRFLKDEDMDVFERSKEDHSRPIDLEGI